MCARGLVAGAAVRTGVVGREERADHKLTAFDPADVATDVLDDAAVFTVTDGIEISPDDQIIAARRGAYEVSLAERGTITHFRPSQRTDLRSSANA